MAAPTQEAPLMTGELTGVPAIVVEYYGKAATELSYSQDELVAAFTDETRSGNNYAVLDVNGSKFESWRIQVGALLPEDLSRGGTEASADVTERKVQSKSTIMHDKQLQAATEAEVESGEPITTGGKGGICISREELAEMGPKARAELFRQHAEAHDINPYNNVTATDINTGQADMDAMAQAISPSYNGHAGAATSGASEQYGGIPAFQNERTGLGGALILDMYLQEQAAVGNRRVIEAMNGGRPLTLLQQAHGKAGSHFLRNLPPYVQPIGLTEWRGTIVSKDGSPLDRGQIADLARHTGLSEESVAEVDNALWLPPEARSEFWATPGADIIIPAFDRNQVTKEDAEAFGGIVIGCLANNPLDHDVLPVLTAKKQDVINDSTFNIGGTLGSREVWSNIIAGGNKTVAELDASWRARLTIIGRTALANRRQLSQERGQFVSIPEAVHLATVDRAVRRLRAVERRTA